MIFSTIKDFPSYLITLDGKVISHKYKTPRRLVTHINRNGYERVGLCKDGKVKMFLVHRLVAETFLDNPDHKPYVNHKDENKLNNDVSNLEWCTAKENNIYGSRLDRIAEAKKRKVLQIDKSGRILRVWKSQTDAADALDIDVRNINQCLKNKRKRCGGYGWRYAYD